MSRTYRMGGFSSNDIVTGLQSSDAKESDEVLSYLHRLLYEKVKNYILTNKGSIEDAEDIFQEGLFSFYKSIKTQSSVVPDNVEAYLFTICRNIWLKQIKKQKIKTLSDSEKVVELGQEAEVLNWEIAPPPSILDQVEKHLGLKCRQVLSYFYYEKRNMQEIAKLTGLANEQVAKNKKSLCLKLLRKMIRENPAFRKVFRRT